MSFNFEPTNGALVPARSFDELSVGEIFRAPSRTLTSAHVSAFQTVSCDNHPIHYDVEYARRFGRRAPVVHGLQRLAFTAPGATFLPHVFGAIFIAFTRVSAEFRAEVHGGDARYPALQIIELRPSPARGDVTTDVTVSNQHHELVLTGRHSYLLSRTPLSSTENERCGTGGENATD